MTKSYDELLTDLSSYNDRTKTATETYESSLGDIVTASTEVVKDRNNANKWASESEDVLVDDEVNTPDYSAKHYSKKAAESADLAANIADPYKGLWPATGGSAEKGDEYQTQVGGTPTGQYFTALQNTTAAPVSDNVNWREVVSIAALPNYTDIVYKSSGGDSAFDVMLSELNSNPLSIAVGSILKTGGTTWEYIDSTGPITRANFRAFNVRNIRDLVNVDESYDYTSKMQSVLDSYSGTRIPLFFSGEFDITETLLLNQQWIISDGAQINKNFDGVGLRITGGSFFFRLRGDLSVVGSGVGFADGSAPSTSPDSHGVSIEGNRLDINGKFESTNNQGHGFYINCNSNMNRSIIQTLHSSSNAGLGIRFTGTNDDCSVWQISTYTTLNYQGGVVVDDDFQGRQWSWFCYNEGSQGPDAIGVYLGRFRASEDVQIYSEEQTSTGFEIQIGSNCENLKVVSLRSGRDDNQSVETCTLISPNGGLWSPEGVAYDIPVRNTAMTNNAANSITKQYYGSSNFLIMEDVIDGAGVATKRVNARTGPVEIDYGVSPTVGVFNRYYGAGYPLDSTFRYSGTRSSPGDASPGLIYRNRNYAQIGGTLREVTRQSFNLDSISTTVGTSSYTVSLMNSGASLVDILKVHSNGDVESLRPGVGFVASSPDGTRYRLAPPNGGGAAEWVLA
ncbi:hypothetical protein VPH184E373B_0072 [Vibrio phage 184E37-3b]|nr:hypothetical protein MYOV056v2_p0062 [Vibrio phage 184E37.3a]QZI89992.1 hypothetical protein MYOV057v1_p0077 [Vibrio phage 184E37.1]